MTFVILLQKSVLIYSSANNLKNIFNKNIEHMVIDFYDIFYYKQKL